MTDFNFEEYEEELNSSDGIHLRSVDMTNIPIFVNASVHAGEAYLTFPEGAKCSDENCDIDHSGERIKHNIVFFDMYEGVDEDEAPARFMVPLESPLGQAILSGDFTRAVLHKMKEFGEQVGEPLQWIPIPPTENTD